MPKVIMRKGAGLLTLVMLLGAVFILHGCASQSAIQPPNAFPEIRIGIVPLPQYAHMWVAHKKGFVDDELLKAGFRLKWQPFSMGPVVNEAFAANHLDMGVMGDFPSFIGRSAGINYRIVSIASAIPKSQALVVKKDSGIIMINDLRGKKVSTSKGSSGQKLLISLLEEQGMTMNDIQFIHMMMDDLAIALMRGNVDAGVMWEPLITRLEEAGEIRIIAEGTHFCPAYSVLVASEDILYKHPEAVDAVRKAYQRGSEYLKENPEECVNLLVEDMKIPARQLLKIISKFNYNTPTDAKFVEDMRDTEMFLRKNGILKIPVDVESFIYR